MKDVIVNGTTYSGISSVLLQLASGDGNAFFRDIDEIAVAPGILEIASGTFSVPAATGGMSTGGSHDFTVEHGMSAIPDVVVYAPKYWYDTQDNQLRVSVVDVRNKVWSGYGRRSVASNTTHMGGGDASAYVDETLLHPCGTAYGQFKPTYIDNDGKEGVQEYIWTAFRFAEV